MSPRAKPVPSGFNTVSAYLIVPSAVEALEFYARALGAKPGVRMPGPDGSSTMHAEMCIGDSMIMLTDESPQWGAVSARTLGGSPLRQAHRPLRYLMGYRHPHGGPEPGGDGPAGTGVLRRHGLRRRLRPERLALSEPGFQSQAQSGRSL